MKIATMGLVPASLLAAALLLGCGLPKNAPVVRPADMKDPKVFEEPVWIAFEAGDELPVYVDVEGPLFVMKPPAPLTVKVKKSFYLLIGDGRPRMSFDRQTLLEPGGSFGFGIGNSKARGPHVNIVVRHGATP